MNGFKDDELELLSECYDDVVDAARLLKRANFPAVRIPVARDAHSFWFDVNSKLINGIMENGREEILAVARKEYPARFKKMKKRASGKPAGMKDRRSGSHSKEQPDQVAKATVRNGQLVGGGAILAALIGLSAGLLKACDNSQEPPEPNPTPSTSASPFSNDLLVELEGKKLVGTVVQDGIKDYNVSVSIAEDVDGKNLQGKVGVSNYAGTLPSGTPFECANDLLLEKSPGDELRLLEVRRGTTACFTEDELRIFKKSDGGLRFELWMTKPQQGVTLPDDRPFGTGQFRAEGSGSEGQTVKIKPDSGPVGDTTIDVAATGFTPNERVKVELRDGGYLKKFDGPYGSEKVWKADSKGDVSAFIQVPGEVCCANGKLSVVVTSIKDHSAVSATAFFTITK
ncbi:effector-associated domain EAD1-containing protein [Streptomyces sp. T028]|uniref:effector-associated domain EAD1-containing protein n=1 Tax=Streptomyces sp. T028 TaxID=3394379 RepID=UPI003A85C528